MRRVEKSKGDFQRKIHRVKRVSKIEEEESVPDESPFGTPKINSSMTDLPTPPNPYPQSSTESIVECLQNVSKTLAEVQNLNESDKVKELDVP